MRKLDAFLSAPAASVPIATVRGPAWSPDTVQLFGTMDYILQRGVVGEYRQLNVYRWRQDLQETLIQANLFQADSYNCGFYPSTSSTAPPPKWRMSPSVTDLYRRVSGSVARGWTLPGVPDPAPAPTGDILVFTPCAHAALWSNKINGDFDYSSGSTGPQYVPGSTSVDVLVDLDVANTADVPIVTGLPYTLLIYYAMVPPVSAARFLSAVQSVFDSSNTDRQVYTCGKVLVTLRGCNSAGNPVENVIAEGQAVLQFRPWLSDRSASIHQVWQSQWAPYYPFGTYQDHEVGVPRVWVVSSNVVFQQASSKRPYLALRVIDLPAFALLGVALVPTDLMMAHAGGRSSVVFPSAALRSARGPAGMGLPSDAIAVDRSASWITGSTIAPEVDGPSLLVWNTFGVTSGNSEGYRFRVTGQQRSTSNYFALDTYITADPGAARALYPAIISEGSVQQTLDMPTAAPYARWEYLVSDDIPVRPGIRYGVHLVVDADVEKTRNSWPAVNSMGAVTRWARSDWAQQVVVFGYDAQGNLVEVAFRRPFGLPLDEWPIWLRSYTPTSNPAYRNYREYYVFADTGGMQVPNLQYPNESEPFGYVVFTNMNVVRARVGILVGQLHVTPTTDVFGAFSEFLGSNVPVVLLPPPVQSYRLLKADLVPLWPTTTFSNVVPLLPNSTADFTSATDWSIETVNATAAVSTTVTGVPGTGALVVTAGTLATIDAETSGQFASPLQPGRLYLFLESSISADTSPPDSITLTLSLYGDGGHHLVVQKLSLSGRTWVYDSTNRVYSCASPLPLGPIDLPITVDRWTLKLTATADSITFKVWWLQVGYVHDSELAGYQAQLVESRTRVVLDQVQRAPAVKAVVPLTESHWVPLIEPGLYHRLFTVPADEAADSPVRQAGFLPDDQLVLVYALPEYAYGMGMPASPGSRQAYPNRLVRLDAILVESGRIRVPGRIVDVEKVEIAGTTLAASQYGFSIMESVIALKDAYSNYTGTATVWVRVYSPFYVYTGFVTGSTGASFVPINLCPFGANGTLGSADVGQSSVALMHPSAAATSGVTLYLMPTLAILRSDYDYGNWSRGLRLLTETVGGYPAHALRHVVGTFSAFPGYSCALVLGTLLPIASLGTAVVQFQDVRLRGGGLPEDVQVEESSRDHYWDLSGWDGQARSGGGHAIVRLPASLLQPTAERDGFTHEQIQEIVRRHLPAGISYEIDYVEV